MKRFIGIDWYLGALKSASPRYWAWVGLLGTLIALGSQNQALRGVGCVQKLARR